MELIRGSNLTFKFESQTDNLLELVSFSVDESCHIGLVGDNGGGKTTLLDIMRGQIPVAEGQLALRRGTTIGHLPQEVRLEGRHTVSDYLWQAREELFRLKKKMHSTDQSSPEYAEVVARYYDLGGGEYDAEIEKVLAGFNLDENLYKMPIETLSGGEKTKIALARILLRHPDIMLLDEPTNHLEIASLVWLENYLHQVSLPYVIISHDRRFLDNCVDEIWELQDKILHVYSGNYSFYKSQKEGGLKKQQKRYENQQKEIGRLREAAQKRRQEASRMEQFKLSRSVTKKGGICKRDDGSGRARSGGADKMRSAKAIEQRIRSMLEKDRAESPHLDRERKISFKKATLKAPFALEIENLTHRFGRRPIFKNLTLSVGSGVKLGIIGSNGSGKSTLLKIITENLKASSGNYRWAPQARIGYFSQEHETLGASNSILDEVLQGRLQEQTRARTILGRLNIRRDKVYQSIGTLSLGERSKTALAKILFSDANVLVLDEPTNHLELSAREALEAALGEYTGTVIVASHDRYLLDRLATEIFDIEKSRYFPGTYSEYVETAGGYR